MIVSEQLLQKIKNAPKIMGAAKSKPIVQGKSDQWSYTVVLAPTHAVDAELSGLQMRVFARQNKRKRHGFSCGFCVIRDGEETKLSRYNGSDHKTRYSGSKHKSKVAECHIHHATVESINENHRVPEHADTNPTDRYTDLDGAIDCLCVDYNISRHNSPQTDLWH